MLMIILIFFLLLVILLSAAIAIILVMQRRSGGTSPPPPGERPIIRAGLEAAPAEPGEKKEEKEKEIGAGAVPVIPPEEGKAIPEAPATGGEYAAPDTVLSDSENLYVDRTDQRKKALILLVGALAVVFVFLLGFIGFWMMKNKIIPSFVSGGGASGGGSPISGEGMFSSGNDCGEYLDESIIRLVFASRYNEEGLNYDLMNIYYFEGSFTAPNRREAIVSFEDYNQSNTSEVFEVWLLACEDGWREDVLIIEGDYCDVSAVDVNGDGVDELEAYVTNYSLGFGGTAYYLLALKDGYVNTIYDVFGEDQLGTPSDWAYNANHYIYFEDRDGNGMLELIDELTYSYYSYDYYYSEWEYQSDEYFTYTYTFGVDEYGDLYLGSYQ